jgi:hypothetical protein
MRNLGRPRILALHIVVAAGLQGSQFTAVGRRVALRSEIQGYRRLAGRDKEAVTIQRLSEKLQPLMTQKNKETQ